MEILRRFDSTVSDLRTRFFFSAANSSCFVLLLALSCHLIFDLLLFLHCVVAVVVYFFGDFNFNILSTRTPSYIPLVLLWFLLYGLSFPGTDNLWRIRNLPILATHDYSDIYLQFCISDENFFL